MRRSGKMTQRYKEIDLKLKNSDLKITDPRRRVLDILENSGVPVSAESIYLMIRGDSVKTNLSTVYRTLETFIDKGLAARFNVEKEKKAFYESIREKHRHYLVCLGCHKIMALDICPLSLYEKELEKNTDYSIVKHKLVLYGYCPQCKAALG